MSTAIAQPPPRGAARAAAPRRPAGRPARRRPAGRRLPSAAAAALSAATFAGRPWRAAAQSFGDNSFTCLLPILEGQPLPESDFWRLLLDASAGGAANVLGGDAGGGGLNGLDGPLTPADRTLLRLASARAAAECQRGSDDDLRGLVLDVAKDVTAAAAGRRPEVHASFARRLSSADDWGPLRREVEGLGRQKGWPDESVGRLVGRAADEARSRESAIEQALRSPTAVALGEPVLHEGEACWKACGRTGGNCSSGFCGGGVCCRRWRLQPECPLGLQGGCSDKYCCVGRPAMVSHEPLECHARPGSYCLASLAQGLESKNVTSLEYCAVQRTINLCPPGFYCLGGKDPPRACRRGRRCTLGSKEEHPCPVGHVCPISIWLESCPAGRACEENATESVLCPEGAYCPNGVSIPCPAGHFCVRGSTRPELCARLAHCPKGSIAQGWGWFAVTTLVVAVPLWTVAVKSVPRWLHPKGGLLGAVPALITFSFLTFAWITNLDLFYYAAKLFDDGDPNAIRIWELLSSSPHSTALVFVTLSYGFLAYGFFISSRIQDPATRGYLDAFVVLGVCFTLFAYLGDWHVLVFLGVLGLSFEVVWVLLTQSGALRFRVGLLSGAIVALASALLCIGAPALALLLCCTLLVAAVREAFADAVPWSRVGAWMKKAPTLKLPLLGSMVAELSPMIRRGLGPELQADPSDEALAAAVTAAARASLDAYQCDRSVAAQGATPFSRGSRWVPPRPSPDDGEDDGSDSDGDEEGGVRGGARAGKGVSFELQNVSYRLDSGRRLLQDVSFAVPSGAMVAIMGASGSGKTTLLSVLSGRCGDGRLEGDLRLNGTLMQPSQMVHVRPMIGYVPQDDVMHTCLTVRENVEFQAQMRRRPEDPESSVASSDLASRIDNVIRGLGLAHVQNRVIRNGLSGGQRKRVSIGMEIVCNPRVLMLDEPSSGLDSSTAHRILLMVIRGSRRHQCTTFSTIHQPRWATLRLFDSLVLLAPGGHLCYAGPLAAMKSYSTAVLRLNFQKDHNPADVIIDATTFESARSMAVATTWKNPPQCLKVILIPTPGMDDDEEKKELWQQDEFGRMLSALWGSFVVVRDQAAMPPTLPPRTVPEGARGASSSPGRAAGLRLPIPSRAELDSLEISNAGWRASSTASLLPSSSFDEGLLLAPARSGPAEGRGGHWARRVWLHMARALLVTSRVLWPTIVVSMALLMVAMGSMVWAFPRFGFLYVFQRSALMLMLLCLVQSVPAQRTFGGEEKQVSWREASVNYLGQVALSFVGKDLASLAEIVLAAMCFTSIYWPSMDLQASGGDIFAVGFACLYCVWGMNHIWAILFESRNALLVAVVAGYLSFLFSGAKPPAHDVAAGFGGYGSLLVLASPIRWAETNLIFRQVVGKGSTYLEGEGRRYTEGRFRGQGFDLSLVPAECPDTRAGVLERWRRHNSWGCHTGQLFLLGILFRFLAAVCLLITNSAKASGGKLSLGLTAAPWRARFLRDALVVFLVFLTMFLLLLLGETY